jgi:predicted kinase
VRSLSSSLAGSRGFEEPDVAKFARLAEGRLTLTAGVLGQRGRSGAVRRCHGDLHLGNIVLWRGQPVLYDAIEFDETIATIDILYDLAFLLMDLDWHAQEPAANLILNRYLWRSGETQDLQGLRALPLFLGLRAAVRALVSADRAGQVQGGARDEARQRARGYLRAALGYLQPPSPCLIAVGGLSGTGKSTLGAAIATCVGPKPGAVHLRSDLERKALFAVAETARLPSQAYTREPSAHVYEILRNKARLVLAAGHAVIADAVHATDLERLEIEAVAAEIGVPFHGIWLEAEREELARRIGERRDDASDATPEILNRQLAKGTGRPSPVWMKVAAGGSKEETLQRAISALGAAVTDAPRAAGGHGPHDDPQL